jgi:predicted ATPase/DNA-binding CsgD family transcriptional regulator
MRLVGESMRTVPLRKMSRGNLPGEVTSFVGRKAELRQLARLLATSRLLSLVGPGGVGKSRLIRRLARITEVRFRDGAWLVDLSTMVESSLVAETVAGVLQVRGRAGHSWPDVLADQLARRRLLLLLDNCEHLTNAVAQLVAHLLRKCPWLVILSSSREPVDVEGEVVWRVGPLSLPSSRSFDLSHVRNTEAVQLFVTRTAAVVSDFALTQDTASAVAQICQRLGGLPLALELVAGTVPGLGLRYIAARLDMRYAMRLGSGDDFPPRQRNMQATVDWSYWQLSTRARLLFQRLAVFVGGWTLEAAEATCSDSQLPVDMVAEVLAELVGRSLVLIDHTVRPARYRFVASTRAYASDMLRASDEADSIHGQHAQYMLSVANSVHPARLDPRHALRLDHDQGNLRAALRWALSRGQSLTACRLAIASYTFWYLRARYAEGHVWLARCAALPVDPAWPTARASAGCLAGHLALLSGDCARAEALLTTALVEHRGLNNQPGIALATHYLALVALWRGDLVRARTLCEAGLAALRLVSEDTDLSRLLSSALTTAAAQVAWELSDDHLARSLIRAADALARAHADRFWLGRALLLQAMLAASDGQPATARTFTQRAVAFMRDQGDSEGLIDALCMRGHLELDRARAREGQADFAEAARLAEASGERIALVSALEGVARALANSRPAGAVRLLALCGAMRKALGCAARPSEERRTAAWLAQARAALGPRGFAAACSAAPGGQPEAVRLARQLTSGDWISNSTAPYQGPLTPREVEVAGRLGLGLSNNLIAEQLGVSVGTVRSHVDHIFVKLGLHSRAQVAVWIVQHAPSLPANVAPTSRQNVSVAPPIGDLGPVNTDV